MSCQNPAVNAVQSRAANDVPSTTAPITNTRPMTGLVAGARTQNVSNSSQTDSSTSVPMDASKYQRGVEERPIGQLEHTSFSSVERPVAVAEIPITQQSSTTTTQTRSGEDIGDGRAYPSNSTSVNTAHTKHSHIHNTTHSNETHHPTHADRDTNANNYREFNPERPNEGSTLKTHTDSWSKKTLYGGPNTKSHYYTDSTTVSQFPITRANAAVNPPANSPDAPIETSSSVPLQYSAPLAHDPNLYNKDRAESTTYTTRDDSTSV